MRSEKKGEDSLSLSLSQISAPSFFLLLYIEKRKGEKKRGIGNKKQREFTHKYSSCYLSLSLSLSIRKSYHRRDKKKTKKLKNTSIYVRREDKGWRCT